MPRLPSLHALRAFEAAARTGSFARAGDDLNLTPSAISHQVRALEAHFGRALFRREGRQVTLTPEGEALAGTLTAAFGMIGEACDALAPPARTRDLRVHCAPSFAAKWLGPRLPGFMAAHPETPIRLTSSADPVDLRGAGEVDVAIAYGRARAAAGVAVASLGREEIAALSAPALAGADPGAVPRLDSSFSPVEWKDWFALNGLAMPKGGGGPSFDRGSLVVAAAAQGLGVALETTRFAREEMAAGALVRFGGGRFRSLEREMHFLVWREEEAEVAKVRRFREWLLEEARSDA